MRERIGGSRGSCPAGKRCSSSLMLPSARGLPAAPVRPGRTTVSSRPRSAPRIASCRSRSEVNTTVPPEARLTAHSSPPAAPSAARATLPTMLVEGITRNSCWHSVHLTDVPRSLTSASSNSYSVPQRSQRTSMTCRLLRSSPGGQTRGQTTWRGPARRGSYHGPPGARGTPAGRDKTSPVVRPTGAPGRPAAWHPPRSRVNPRSYSPDPLAFFAREVDLTRAVVQGTSVAKLQRT